jgi:hypothetical protein
MGKLKSGLYSSHSISLENRLLIIKLGIAVGGTLLLILLLTCIIGPMHSHATPSEVFYDLSLQTSKNFIEVGLIKAC